MTEPQPKRPNPTVPETGMSDIQAMLIEFPLIFMLGYLIAAFIHTIWP